MQSVQDQIVPRIQRAGVGKAFIATDFLDIASRGSVDMALSDLTREGSFAVSNVVFMTCRR